MSLIRNRKAIGLSINELSNRITSLYDIVLNPEMIKQIEQQQLTLNQNDAKILAVYLLRLRKIYFSIVTLVYALGKKGVFMCDIMSLSNPLVKNKMSLNKLIYPM
ncbi:hypothetical protein QI073_03195 [Staphylococcus saprophyticus]|nr:hypothetical protein [Staphylococcus saprophyticus]